MDCSPRKSVEVKINCVIVSVSVLSVVAKVNRSIGVVMSVPMYLFEESSRDVTFSPMFKGDIGFV